MAPVCHLIEVFAGGVSVTSTAKLKYPGGTEAPAQHRKDPRISLYEALGVVMSEPYEIYLGRDRQTWWRRFGHEIERWSSDARCSSRKKEDIGDNGIVTGKIDS